MSAQAERSVPVPKAQNFSPRARAVGLLTALATLVLDQANKLWLIFGYGIAAHQPIRLTPFFDVVFLKNTGISYSLFTAQSDFGRWALLLIAAVATACLMLWLWRTRLVLTGFALGLIIGGALGNAADRLAYGYVADFYHFHVGDFSWYVFNLADVAICIGVGLLLIEGLGEKPRRKADGAE
ncbi:MAG: signal peptidase II [Methylovirgula sp.]